MSEGVSGDLRGVPRGFRGRFREFHGSSGCPKSASEGVMGRSRGPHEGFKFFQGVSWGYMEDSRARNTENPENFRQTKKDIRCRVIVESNFNQS